MIGGTPITLEQRKVILYDQMSRKDFTSYEVEFKKVLYSRSEACSLHLSSALTLIYRRDNRNQKERMAKSDHQEVVEQK